MWVSERFSGIGSARFVKVRSCSPCIFGLVSNSWNCLNGHSNRSRNSLKSGVVFLRGVRHWPHFVFQSKLKTRINSSAFNPAPEIWLTSKEMSSPKVSMICSLPFCDYSPSSKLNCWGEKSENSLSKSCRAIAPKLYKWIEQWLRMIDHWLSLLFPSLAVRFLWRYHHLFTCLVTITLSGWFRDWISLFHPRVLTLSQYWFAVSKSCWN
jgi:hypothetical protein